TSPMASGVGGDRGRRPTHHHDIGPATTPMDRGAPPAGNSLSTRTVRTNRPNPRNPDEGRTITTLGLNPPKELASCSSCRAPIRWLKHVRTGNLAPIDSHPGPGGNI